MKKTLLTIGAVLGVSVGAFAQGSIQVETPSLAGFNTASSNPSDGTVSDFPSGTLTLEIFVATSAADANLASQASAIDTDDLTVGGAANAVSLLQADFTQMPFGASVSSENMQNNFTISEGSITAPGVYAVGTAGTLPNSPTATVGEYGILAIMTISGKTYEGALVLNSGGALQMGGGSNANWQMESTWPNQNMLLAAPVPEPTTIALAGLGGLALLGLRRRKA